MSKFVKLFFVSTFILAMSAIAFGQSTTTGAIGGLVTNPNNEVVPGAVVTVLNIETNNQETATTSDEGQFRVVNLQPAVYTVTVNAAGFGGYTQERVIVEVGRITNLEVQLAVGQVQGGTVDVTAEAPVINTSQQDFSTNVNQVSINELPNNGRRWSNFALGTPGAVTDGPFGLISFRGISGLLNNNTIDGGDNNNAFYSEERGRTRINYSISQASIREFQVNTSNYSAEYGRAAGGVINAVTKSGTNDFHGGAFIFFRDERFNARNPSTFVDGRPVRPEDNRKQYGFTIGGPIIKDKLFFFFSFDQQKRLFPGVAAPTNETFFTTFDRAGLIAKGVTGAQADAALAVVKGLTGEVPRRGDQTLYLPKIDWHINSKNILTFTYNRLEWVSPAGVQTGVKVTRGTNSFGDDLVDVNWGTLRLTSTLTPNILNEARVQIARDFERQIAQPPGPGEPTNAIGGSSPQVAVGTGGLTIGKPNSQNRIAQPDERRQQVSDTVTVTHGNHTFKFGTDTSRVSDLNYQLFNESGSYSYTNFNDYLMDYANFAAGGALRTAAVRCYTAPATGTVQRFAGQCYSGSFSQGFGSPAFTIVTRDYAGFFQDDWRMTPQLTLNLGVRYEYQQLPSPQLPNTLFDSDPQFRGKTSVFPADKNNWGPRFGFAYDMTGDGKNSIRGGWGIYYGRITNSSIMSATSTTGASGSQFTVSLSPTSTTAAERAVSPVFPNVFAAAPSVGTRPIPNVVVFAPNMANPVINQMDLVYEREVAHNTVASVSVLMSLGRRLPQYVDVNLARPTTVTNFTVVGGPYSGQIVTVPKFTNPRLNTNFNVVTEIQPTINTEYEALVLQLNRRFTRGLQFQASYTLSRSFDNGQNSATFVDLNNLYNPFDLSVEKGLSNFDQTRKVVVSAVWHPEYFDKSDNTVARWLLSGYNIAPIFSAGSGFPYSAGVSGSVSATVSGGGGITGSNGGNRFPLDGRNTFRSPRVINMDLRVSRRFRFTENMNLELLAEGFNIFNRSQIVNVDTTAYNLSGTTLTFRPQFQSTAFTSNFFIKERQFQFGMRFEF
jgi:carboxypeptidase family protein/TonB-dependent receptor-like protein